MSGALRAPGKLFLAGEYAVLEAGRPALVLAVDRALHAAWSTLEAGRVELVHAPSGTALAGRWDGALAWDAPVPAGLRFAARACEVALRLCAEEGRAPRGLKLDFADDLSLGPGAPKLGLGGSAAASVLAVQGAALAQGRTLAPREALALALAAHWAEQGGSGSGADVAASALGGALEVRVRHAWASPAEALRAPLAGLLATPPLQVAPLRLPGDLRLLLAWTGASADTRVLVRAVRAFAAEAPGRWGRLANEISFAAEGLRDALAAAACDHGVHEAVLACVRRAAMAMAALGDESGAGIVTADLVRIGGIAASQGCAAKPSGAGGGDCAVVFCFGDEARGRAKEALEAEGYVTLPIAAAG